MFHKRRRSAAGGQGSDQETTHNPPQFLSVERSSKTPKTVDEGGSFSNSPSPNASPNSVLGEIPSMFVITESTAHIPTAQPFQSAESPLKNKYTMLKISIPDAEGVIQAIPRGMKSKTPRCESPFGSLDVPITLDNDGKGFIHNVEESYSISLWKGRRRTMEDTFLAVSGLHGDPRQALFGVFDGHGKEGKRAAKMVARKLSECIVETQMCAKSGVEQGLVQAFKETDAEVMKSIEQGGSTAVCCLIQEGSLTVANVGDSRCVLSRNGVAVSLSHDHKPEREDEKQMIEKRGGRVVWCGGWRVEGILNLSRSMGDRTLKQFISADPDILQQPLQTGDEFLILASDGVWGVLGEQAAVDIVRPFLTSSHSQPPGHKPGTAKAAAAAGRGGAGGAGAVTASTPGVAGACATPRNSTSKSALSIFDPNKHSNNNSNSNSSSSSSSSCSSMLDLNKQSRISSSSDPIPTTPVASSTSSTGATQPSLILSPSRFTNLAVYQPPSLPLNSGPSAGSIGTEAMHSRRHSSLTARASSRSFTFDVCDTAAAAQGSAAASASTFTSPFSVASTPGTAPHNLSRPRLISSRSRSPFLTTDTPPDFAGGRTPLHLHLSPLVSNGSANLISGDSRQRRTFSFGSPPMGLSIDTSNDGKGKHSGFELMQDDDKSAAPLPSLSLTTLPSPIEKLKSADFATFEADSIAEEEGGITYGDGSRSPGELSTGSNDSGESSTDSSSSISTRAVSDSESSPRLELPNFDDNAPPNLGCRNNKDCAIAQAADALASAAFDRDSYDNISVVIVVLRQYFSTATG